MKKNNKKIKALILLFILSFTILNVVQAAVTSGNGGTTTNATVGENIMNTIFKAFGAIGNIALTGVGAFITPLINILSLVLLLLLQIIFSVSGAGASSPFPDAVVFNKVPLLDANFINPHNNSLIVTMGQSTFTNLFASFRVIAQALFIIAAMITGLKLALSTIASKKAQYKEALMKWVMGFVILFGLKWILAGVFYINELIVSTLASIPSTNFAFKVKVLNFVPVIGAAINLLTEAIANYTVTVPIKGFGGMVAMIYAEAGGGNIIASIVAFIILGQTFVILGSYIKRLFMCILLGVVSPLIIAVDTIVGITGSKSTIFQTWLKNFIFTVFSQSFHAAYMVVALQILNKMWGANETSFQSKYIETIVTIVLLTGLVKLEKTLKGMFGMGDSMAGALSDGSKGMKKAMQAAAGLAAAGKAVGDNVGKFKDARVRKTAIGNEQASLKAGLAKEKSAYEAAKEAKANGNMAEYHKQMKIAADQRRINLGTGSNGGGSNNNNGSSNNSGQEKDYLQSVLNKQTQPKTAEEKLKVLGEAQAKARADEKSAMLATTMSIPNLAAGIGIGLGMGDDIGETLFKGGMVTAALDKGAEAIGYRMADKDRRTLDESERRDGKKYGYTPSENIQREKTNVEAALTFDIKKLNSELTKQFRDLGYVFTDQVKKELKQIDKDLDNE